MQPVILMRASLAEQEELEAAVLHLPVYRQRSEVPEGSLVIGRYSVLPYYRELAKDLELRGSRLINTPAEHDFVADLWEWYGYLRDHTFETWRTPAEVPADEPGPFVLKGATNSRKQLWKTHMFAKDRAAMGRVFNELLDDTLIGAQPIRVRKFETLVTYGYGPQEQPITDEWRFFVLDGQVIAGGFYWSEHYDDLRTRGATQEMWNLEEAEACTFAQTIAKHLDFIRRDVAIPVPRFYVIDVGRRADGVWRVVELNDGCMSGLSCVSAPELYAQIAAGTRNG